MFLVLVYLNLGVGVKFPVFHHAAMRKSTSMREFMTDLRCTGIDVQLCVLIKFNVPP